MIVADEADSGLAMQDVWLRVLGREFILSRNEIFMPVNVYIIQLQLRKLYRTNLLCWKKSSFDYGSKDP